ncbi:hypothetical protein SAMN05518672_1078 [Chitinophaga sp. CF118]|uniref:hypothetical protein n=1 Tax=Chitinophaga sp. CF118 TaxID=1884367 RepID=UPI0008E52861|nr:hypothetical protein [Chitinophaga sp. CF118]SFE49781.1 hypothetical protein SAMN05518672_1078 [Chitinophaga sp. CF118]
MNKKLAFVSCIILFSCSEKINQQTVFDHKYFESSRGPLFSGNQIWFNSANTFEYIKHSAGIYISKGHWKYDANKNEITLIADIPFTKTFPHTIDTMWLDVTGQKMQIKSEKQILFDGILYNLK